MKENRPYRIDNKSLQLSVPRVLSRLCLQSGITTVPNRQCRPLSTTGCRWHHAQDSFISDFFLWAASFGPTSRQASSTALNDLFHLTSMLLVNCKHNFLACGQSWERWLFFHLSSLSLITDGIYFDSLFCAHKCLPVVMDQGA